jgi:hypothetical protein
MQILLENSSQLFCLSEQTIAVFPGFFRAADYKFHTNIQNAGYNECNWKEM